LIPGVSLVETGADVVGRVRAAVLLVLAGLVLVAVGRRRQRRVITAGFSGDGHSDAGAASPFPGAPFGAVVPETRANRVRPESGAAGANATDAGHTIDEVSVAVPGLAVADSVEGDEPIEELAVFVDTGSGVLTSAELVEKPELAADPPLEDRAGYAAPMSSAESAEETLSLEALEPVLEDPWVASDDIEVARSSTLGESTKEEAVEAAVGRRGVDEILSEFGETAQVEEPSPPPAPRRGVDEILEAFYQAPAGIDDEPEESLGDVT
jgi:hypothetical protein